MEQGIKFNITSDTRGLERGAKRTKKKLNDLSNTTQRSTKSNRNASAAAVEFGRVLGDLPFGIQGVANNIQQLAFVMGGSAALQIGIAAVTSLWLVFEDEIKKSVFSVDAFTEATRNATAEIQGERATMSSLIAIARDENQERQKRVDAIKVLNNQYPELNNQIKLETINTKATTRAIEEATRALENRAKIRAAEDLISQEAEKVFKKRVDLEKDRENAIASALNAQLQDYNTFSRGIQGATFDYEKARTRIEERVNKEFANRLKSSEKDYRDYIQRLNKIISESDNLLDVFGVTEKIKAQKIDYDIPIVKNPFANFIEPDLLSGQAKIAFQNLSKVLKEDGPTIIEPGLSAIEQRMFDFKERLANSTLDLAGAIGSGFASIGMALGQGANLFSAVGAAILQTMGDIAVQLGQAAIAAGIAGIALKNLFANPAAAIAAGGVLVALGSALKAATNSVSGIGGGSSTGSSAGKGFQGATVSSGSFQQGFGGRVVFEIGGRKLIGVLNNTLSAGERLGGNVNIR